MYKGEVLVLFGGNGVGKFMIIKMFLGLMKFILGDVLLVGVSVLINLDVVCK